VIELNGQPANLFFTLEVTRAATGKTETFEMIGHADPEELKKLTEGAEIGSHTLKHGAVGSD
jgi:hypothetical protein